MTEQNNGPAPLTAKVAQMVADLKQEITVECVNSEMDRIVAGRIMKTLTALATQLADRDAELARVTAERDASQAGWDDQKARHKECFSVSVQNLYRALEAELQVTAREARIAALTEALRRSTEGWSNALELGLIPDRHRNTAFILRDAGFAAITTDKEPKT